MGENNGDSSEELTVPTGTTQLTAKEEHFPQLIALEGYKQSAAYRASHDVSPNTNPSTPWDNASRLAAQVAPRFAELRPTV